MQPTTELPANYEAAGEIDLSQKGMVLLLNLVSLLLFFVFGGAFVYLTLLLRPNLETLSWQLGGVEGLLPIFLLFVLILAQIVLHELFHGLFFWLFTRSRPEFGFRGMYAYAAAPDWFLPRNQHLVVGMAPLVGITLLGLLLILVVPAVAVLPLLFLMTINAAGSIGDMVVLARLLFQPRTTLVRDVGDVVKLYHPSRL